jgi:hypothetical protein
MRIIGGRDYYDGAGYGFDSSINFVRKPTLLETSPLVYCTRGVVSGMLTRFDVVVAGELYPAMVYTESSYKPSSTYYYTADTVHEIADLIPRYYYAENKFTLDVSDARREEVRRWALENKIVTAISGVEILNDKFSIHSNWTSKPGTLVNGDFLKTVDFYRVLPPALAHRAIASWVSGVLPFDVPTVGISDRSRIVKAGFDIVTSFRKQKA